MWSEAHILAGKAKSTKNANQAKNFSDTFAA